MEIYRGKSSDNRFTIVCKPPLQTQYSLRVLALVDAAQDTVGAGVISESNGRQSYSEISFSVKKGKGPKVQGFIAEGIKMLIELDDEGPVKIHRRIIPTSSRHYPGRY